MSTNNNILVYDNSCPMCSGYTKLFVRAGLLTIAGRISFSEINPDMLGQIDPVRSKNEIPLLNLSTHEVRYGIHAMVYLIEQKYSWIGTIYRIQPIHWFLHTLYKFISFNRRVIVAPKETSGFNCAPDFNLLYRLLFMAIFLLFNTMMLYPVYAVVLQHSYFNGSSITQFQILHLALIAVNIIAALTLAGGKWVEYLGQVNMLALTVILLILPLIFLNHFFTSPGLNNSYLCCLGIFTVREYARRMRYARVWNNHPLIVINGLSILFFLMYLL